MKEFLEGIAQGTLYVVTASITLRAIVKFNGCLLEKQAAQFRKEAAQ